tara:strand:+ start:310 stop:1287 length:978 start_codon:yes stop_codon:yes gene_type:complete
MTNNSICVVGAGSWGKNHVSALYQLGLLGGIVDQNQEILYEFSKKYKNVQTYHNLDEALKNEKFKGFTVATPANTHHDIGEKIINFGKHVIIEKPICLNLKDGEHLVKLSKINNVNLMVGHILLFHPAIQKIKKLINENKIGKLQYIYNNRLNLGEVRSEENVFWSLAPHDISIFQYLTNSYPASISAIGSSFLQPGIHDSTITHLKYPNGIDGHIFVSWLHPFKEHRLVVVGSEAMIVFEDSVDGKPLKLYSKKFDLDLGIPEKVDGPIELIDYDQKMPLTEELQYFANHLGDKKPKIANGKHAIEVLKILDEASKQLENREKE